MLGKVVPGARKSFVLEIKALNGINNGHLVKHLLTLLFPDCLRRNSDNGQICFLNTETADT